MMLTGNGSAVSAKRVLRHYQIGSALVRAADDVTLEIPAGEFQALLGSSGSGKSTLLNLMADLDRPTSVSIFAQGRDLSEMNPLKLARYRSRTVGMMPLCLAEVDRGERAGRVREALERVGLETRLTHRPSELSGGEQQRVALAGALVNCPTLLLADEPTSSLDSATGESIMVLLCKIQRSLGMTIVLVTHERPLVERFADRIASVAAGKLASDAVQS